MMKATVTPPAEPEVTVVMTGSEARALRALVGKFGLHDLESLAFDYGPFPGSSPSEVYRACSDFHGATAIVPGR